MTERTDLLQQIGYLKECLNMIAELEPGSRGAYHKFARAQEIAKNALTRFGEQGETK